MTSRSTDPFEGMTLVLENVKVRDICGTANGRYRQRACLGAGCGVLARRSATGDRDRREGGRDAKSVARFSALGTWIERWGLPAEATGVVGAKAGGGRRITALCYYGVAAALLLGFYPVGAVGRVRASAGVMLTPSTVQQLRPGASDEC